MLDDAAVRLCLGLLACRAGVHPLLDGRRQGWSWGWLWRTWWCLTSHFHWRPLGGDSVGWMGGGFRRAWIPCERVPLCAKVAAAEACCSPKNACRSVSWAVAGMYPPGCWQSSTAHGRCTRVPLGWVEPAARRAAGRLFSAAARRWPEAVAMSCSVVSMCCSNCHGIGAAVCSCVTRRCHACPVLGVCCHAAVASGCKRLVPARSRGT